MSIPCREIFKDLADLQVEFTVKSGRFPEEKNMEILLASENVQKRLLVMKVFYGRPPYYRRWVEVFSISRELTFNSGIFRFIGSVYEERLIECLSRFLEGGERLFIDYMYDDETRRALELGIPPPLTRLGYMLLQRGFTWFKDWYYPEGFMEGGPKLQVEKPVDENSRKIHMEELCREVRDNLDRIRGFAILDEYSWIASGVLKRIEGLSAVCRSI
ncbi:MAG: DUF1122 family protein [Ignisphaera sp.]|uniref:DUF1122 domain-containing protein n=1 Tax=Ignisphaera aggregans TaxID=334771 RepID=A0A7J3JQZ7_9CREN